MDLPELHQADLDADEVRQLFADLAGHAELIAIDVRGAARDVGPRDLEAARQLVETHGARGVRIRYRYEGAEWWDTLMIREDGVRLVRVRQNERGVDG